MGPVRFVLFYLVCGLTASFAHIVFGPGSEIPAVGASGAISGVLGGYLLLFPGNRVRVLTRRGIAHVPAMVVLGFWIPSSSSTASGRWPRRRKRGASRTWPTSVVSWLVSCSSS
jgi:membrane associated rhomboid family serine protease